MADEVALEMYKETRSFPPDERFALQSQMRRAALSVPTNIVEGCARRSGRDFLEFLDIAMGSASEARYLTRVATRLGYVSENSGRTLHARFGELIKALQALIGSIERLAARSTSPRARNPLRTED